MCRIFQLKFWYTNFQCVIILILASLNKTRITSIALQGMKQIGPGSQKITENAYH